MLAFVERISSEAHARTKAPRTAAPRRPPRTCRRATARTDVSQAPGDSVPAVTVCSGMQFPPVPVDVAAACAGKKVLIMGLPGAFTPC